MASFLKPKKYDPDHARRTLEEEERRREDEQAKIKAKQQDTHAMRVALGLTEKVNYDDEDSLPSASDTSDEEDSDLEGEDHAGAYGGKDTCPMRQYELLQRRYLRAMQELHAAGDRERNNEGLLVKLKLMSKQQTAIVKRSMQTKLVAKDALIATMLTTMRQLQAGDQLVDVFEKEFSATKQQESSAVSAGKKGKDQDNKDNNNVLKLQTMQEDVDVLRVSLSKAEACNASLESENTALRQSLQDLGTEDPSVLVLLKEKLRVTKKEMSEVESMFNIMKVEQEENEHAATAAAGDGDGVADGTHGSVGTAVDVDATQKKMSQSMSSPKKGKSKSNEQKLLRELKKMASKVKKLEAGKMALMSILKEAQSELSKRRDASAKEGESDTTSSTSSTSSTTLKTEQDAAAAAATTLKKKDKSIKKLKSQVKQLTTLLREVEAKRQEKSAEQAETAEASKTDTASVEASEAALAEALSRIVSIKKEADDELKKRLEQQLHNLETKTVESVTLVEQEKVALQQSVSDITKDRDDQRKMLLNVRRSHQDKVLSMENNLRRCKEQLQQSTQQTSAVAESMTRLQTQCRALASEMVRMKSTVQKQFDEMPQHIALVTQQLSSRLTKQLATFQGLADKYKREYRERKRLFNLVQELRGNIRGTFPYVLCCLVLLCFWFFGCPVCFVCFVCVCVFCVFIALLLNKRNRREFGRSLFCLSSTILLFFFYFIVPIVSQFFVVYVPLVIKKKKVGTVKLLNIQRMKRTKSW